MPELDAKEIELLNKIILMLQPEPKLTPEDLKKKLEGWEAATPAKIDKLYEIARKRVILDACGRSQIGEVAKAHGIEKEDVRKILEDIAGEGLPIPRGTIFKKMAEGILEGLKKVHTLSIEEIKAVMPGRAPKEPEATVKTQPPRPGKGKKPISPAQEEKNKIVADAIKKLEIILDKMYFEHKWQAEEDIRDAIEDTKKVAAGKESLELHLNKIKGKFNPFEVLHILYSAKRGIRDPMTAVKISKLLMEKVADWRKNEEAFRILEGALEKKGEELKKLGNELKKLRLGPPELGILLKQINELEPFSEFGIHKKRGAAELKKIIARNVCRWEFDRMRKLGIPYIAMGKSVGANLFENSTVSEIMNEDENKDMKKIKGSEIILKLINANVIPDTLPLPERLYHKHIYIAHIPTLERKLKEWIPKPK